jgi:hypothetical protein
LRQEQGQRQRENVEEVMGSETQVNDDSTDGLLQGVDVDMIQSEKENKNPNFTYTGPNFVPPQPKKHVHLPENGWNTVQNCT